jgi:signal transduction histidine kinase
VVYFFQWLINKGHQMSEEERKNLRQSLQEMWKIERQWHHLQEQVQEAQQRFYDARRKIDAIVPVGDPVVVTFRTQGTWVLRRGKDGLAEHVDIQQATAG